MKKISFILSILLLIFLSACNEEDVQENITVIFKIEDQIYKSILTLDTTLSDYNNEEVPIKENHDFKGWYYDLTYLDPYQANDKLENNTVLYAYFEFIYEEIFYIVSFNTNGGSEVADIEVLANSNITLPINPTKNGFTFKGWYLDTTYNNPFNESIKIIDDVTLYALFIENVSYVISFNTNGGSEIEDIEVNQVQIISKPTNPTRSGYSFEGWYIDASLSIIFDFNTEIDNDIILYAKWQYNFESGTVYSIDGDYLVFAPDEDAVLYHIYIGKDTTNPIITTSTTINFSTYKDILKTKTNVEVYAEYADSENVKLFDLDLQYQDNSILYQTDFESAEFVASTTYNNSSVKYTGPSNQQWAYVSGTTSTTNAINGKKSFQMRDYASVPTRYLEMNFELKDISRISFNAMSASHDLNIKYYVNGLLSSFNQFIDLSSSTQTYHVDINATGMIKIRFEMTTTASDSRKPLIIDNIFIYGNSSGSSLVEVPKVIDNDYPETSEEKLANLKSQSQADRSNLKAPTFVNALSQEGLVTYYASLSGLTGNQFKKELEKITTENHKNITNYGEARFILEKADLVTDKEGRQYLDGLYSSTKIVKYWDKGETWDREHVWPNSRLGVARVSNSDRNQASDVHNLRAANPSVNSSRGNRYFVNGTMKTNHTVGSDGYYPGDEYIGDVARILFYMVVRYPNILTLADEGFNGSSYTKEAAVMGVLSLLLQWHEADPVSDFEINRNNIIYSYQGNRNPFIDHPNYVQLYFS